MRRVRDERGTVTAFVVGFTFALLVVTGLVVDGGGLLSARRVAINEAEAAARAGAQSVDPVSLRGGSTVVLDPETARQRALAYLRTTGHTGVVDVTGDTVTVTVSFSRPMAILGIAGLGSKTVQGRGSAHAAKGVTREGD
jgi:hypothetical protein